ncbi:PfkB family carbohydrate kinase, partial [Pseudonocardia halophobica]|uniref:PfkB family carbohydrate kinase n=1 Tax=Pseudonocardia halophobica TaxID=29401 RepID=UPI0022F2C464
VRYCGAVGADDTGTGALAELRAEGIDVTDVAVLKGVATGMALIVVDGRGENQIAVGAGANAAVEPAAVRAAVARSAEWAGCVLVSTEIPSEAVAAAVETAVAYGLACVLNPAPVTAELVDLLGLGPVVTPNRSELRDLYALVEEGTADSVAEMAAAVAALTGASVVVTLGGDGVLIVDPERGATPLPAPPATVRDTTGAGDTFNGVLAAALAAGAAVPEAAARGVAAASLSVGTVGARAGMPRAAAIDGATGPG